MIIVSAFLRWLTPYKYVDEVIERKPKKQKHKQQKLTAEEMLEHGMLGVRVVEVGEKFVAQSATERLLGSEVDIVYFYHDKQTHQVAVSFDPKSAWKYQARSNSKRKNLKPMLYPEGKTSYDRTHIIPIGFHGTESDNRLLVGWNSRQNRVDINRFERKVREYNKNHKILWFADIAKEPDGSATWKAIVMDETGTVRMKHTWHDRSKFVWQ